VGAVTTEASTVLMLLRRVTSALCVECLAEITAVPLSTIHATTTGLLEAGSLIVAPELPCPLCQAYPALMLPADSVRTFQLIIVRRDRPETLLNMLGAATCGPWPPGTAVMLDRRVGERRSESRQAIPERRHGARRAEAEAMWHAADFIVVKTEHNPQ
jgi:hypothetical protein